MKCIVKSGKVLAHHGEELRGGTRVDLPPHIAHDVRHLVDEIDEATGETRAIGSASEDAQLRGDLERAQPHERVTILEQALAGARARVDLLQKLLGEAKAANAVAAPKPAPPASPVTSTVSASVSPKPVERSAEK